MSAKDYDYIKQFDVTEATPRGEIKEWNGKQYQDFWIKAHGLTDKPGSWATTTRLAGQPLLSGPTWFKVKEKNSQKGNLGYILTFTKDIPTNAPSAAQTELPLGTVDKGISWGEAVVAASMLLTTPYYKEMLEQGMDGLRSQAQSIFSIKAPDLVALAEQKKHEEDVVIQDVPDELDYEDMGF